MPFIPVPNCIQARLLWNEDNGVVAQNVFYHGTPGVPTLAQMEEIGGIWGELMTEAGLVPQITDNWALASVNMRSMTEEEGIVLNFSDGMPISGDIHVGQLPDQVAYTITWSTGMSGRSARGRTYALGIGAGQTANRNRLTTGAQGELQNCWNLVRETFETAGFALQVVSFQEDGVMRAEGRKLPILSQSVRFPLATQRRRLS